MTQPTLSAAVTGVYPTLTFPLWRSALFTGLVSRPSVRYFLGRTFGSKDVPDSLVDYSWRTAHQPGALVYFQQPELFLQRWSAFLAQ